MLRLNGKRPRYKYMCTLGKMPPFVSWRITKSIAKEIINQMNSNMAKNRNVICDPQHPHTVGPPASAILSISWYFCWSRIEDAIFSLMLSKLISAGLMLFKTLIFFSDFSLIGKSFPFSSSLSYMSTELSILVPMVSSVKVFDFTAATWRFEVILIIYNFSSIIIIKFN